MVNSKAAGLYQHTGDRFNHRKGLVSTDKTANKTQRKEIRLRSPHSFFNKIQDEIVIFICLSEIKSYINETIQRETDGINPLIVNRRRIKKRSVLG